MLVHLGEDKSVFSKDIIAILDLNSLPFDPERNDAMSSKPMKSLLITATRRIYTPFAAQTLARRARPDYRNIRYDS